MWQTIEYKAAAIEQFRKGDLLQRVIDDVASEAANTAEMKAAASGNPLILIQVQLATELQKLEALYSQYQRSQHRLKDSLKWLKGSDERLEKAEAIYADNCRLRDCNTRIVKEKDKDKIVVELLSQGEILYAKDSDKIQDRLLSGIKEVTRNSGASVLFGKYRGFEIHIVRVFGMLGGDDGFRLTLTGANAQQFKPMNLVYSFNDKLSLAGMFQRIDNFLTKGLDETINAQREMTTKEKAELLSVNAALGKEFPQKAELELTRENHAAVIRELQKMQDNPEYVSTWQPKMPEAPAKANNEMPATGADATPAEASQDKIQESHWRKLEFEQNGSRFEYAATDQHNGYQLDGYVLKRTSFDAHIGSICQSLYEDGQWHTTATVPATLGLRRFDTPDKAIDYAQADARERGLMASPQTGQMENGADSEYDSDKQRASILSAGFTSLGRDCLGWEEYGLKTDADDGGSYAIRLSCAGNEIAVNVQYEKDHIVDGRRTIRGSFNNLGQALDFVGTYMPPSDNQENNNSLTMANRIRFR